MSAQVRELGPGDRTGFVAIMQASGFVDGYSDEEVGRFLDDSDNIVYLGAFDEDTVAGVLSLTFGESSYKLSPFAWCDDMFVLESHRGKGVGRLLLERAAALARERACSNILLGVAEDDPRAIAFYERAGFKDMRCRLMTLPLQ